MSKEITRFNVCCVGYIVWGELEIDDNSIYYPGKCSKCGTQYQEVFIREGIVEKNTQEWVDCA